MEQPLKYRVKMEWWGNNQYNIKLIFYHNLSFNFLQPNQYCFFSPLHRCFFIFAYFFVFIFPEFHGFYHWGWVNLHVYGIIDCILEILLIGSHLARVQHSGGNNLLSLYSLLYLILLIVLLLFCSLSSVESQNTHSEQIWDFLTILFFRFKNSLAKMLFILPNHMQPQCIRYLSGFLSDHL